MTHTLREWAGTAGRAHARRLLGLLDTNVRPYVSFQPAKNERRRPAWLVRVQRYGLIAQWRYLFDAQTARSALDAAAMAATQAVSTIDALNLPARSRAALVKRSLPRNASRSRGIETIVNARGKVTAYRVHWRDENKVLRTQRFEVAEGSAFDRAKRFRAAMEIHAVRLDQQAQTAFAAAMRNLGATVRPQRHG